MTRPPPFPIRPLRAGLSLVEVLISLAITATLLTAVAMAFSASAQAIEINDQFFRASQAARVSVNRIVRDLRQCNNGTITGTSTLSVDTPGGDTHTYAHDAVNKRLTFTLDPVPTPTTYTLASNVESVSFFTDGNSLCVNIVVTVGRNKVVLNGSAVPRKKVVYQ